MKFHQRLVHNIEQTTKNVLTNKGNTFIFTNEQTRLFNENKKENQNVNS